MARRRPTQTTFLAEPVRVPVRITDPRRQLPAGTFALPEPLSCYCRGCYQGAILSAIHRLFGRVQCCADHHPARAALARPFGQVAAVPPVTAAGPQPADDPIQLAKELASCLNSVLNGPEDTGDGGLEVPRVQITPPIPPSDGEALAVPFVLAKE
jgi:hypothetical protein